MEKKQRVMPLTEAGLFTLEDVRKEFGVSRKAVERWIREGLITPKVVVGSSYLFDQKALDKLKRIKRNEDGLISAHEMAKRLGISRQALYKIFEKFEIKSVRKVGRSGAWYPEVLTDKIRRFREGYAGELREGERYGDGRPTPKRTTVVATPASPDTTAGQADRDRGY